MAIEDTGIIVPEFRTEEERLDYTNNMRLRLIAVQTENGKKLPEDKDSVLLINDLLNSVDKQSLTRMKMRLDTQESNEDRRVALMVAKLNAGVRGDPFRVDTPIEGHVPQIDEKLLEGIEVQDFAMEQGITTEQYVEFTKKFND